MDLAQIRDEIERRRDARYEVATDCTDEGRDAQALRPYGYVEACDEILALLDGGADHA